MIRSTTVIYEVLRKLDVRALRQKDVVRVGDRRRRGWTPLLQDGIRIQAIQNEAVRIRSGAAQNFSPRYI